MLWLALRFPLLPLEALPSRSSPSAIVAQGRVRVCDSGAASAGIQPGQKLSTALGLAPGLCVFERDVVRESRALEQLACWAGRFTPTVAVEPPDRLLLEIGGCLRLFGGAEAIVKSALDGVAEQGGRVEWAAAPVPLGAEWLARAGCMAIFNCLEAMQAALADIPTAVPEWPGDVLRRLEAYGLRSLSQLRQLPAASLRQRLGVEPMDELLRAWGEVPDPRRAFVFPESFAAELELPSRVEHAEGLAFAAQRLFASLTGWLDARQLLLRRCHLALTHDDGAVSHLELGFSEPLADEAYFMRLLREHLARLVLRDPVVALRLSADEVLARSGSSLSLFAEALPGEGAAACLDRLQARLGEGAVHGLAARADYRPECAAVLTRVGTGSKPPLQKPPMPLEDVPDFATHRPLWLLPESKALAERHGVPHWHGPLKLLSRGERLESGWWDEGETEAEGDVRRDYFVACNPQGQWAWIFRDANGWFLHGVFA